MGREREEHVGQPRREERGKLGALKRGGEEATTTSVRKARDWLFRTRLESIHQGGAMRSVTTRAGESGRRPCLARRSTWLFMSSSA